MFKMFTTMTQTIGLLFLSFHLYVSISLASITSWQLSQHTHPSNSSHQLSICLKVHTNRWQLTNRMDKSYVICIRVFIHVGSTFEGWHLIKEIFFSRKRLLSSAAGNRWYIFTVIFPIVIHCKKNIHGQISLNRNLCLSMDWVKMTKDLASDDSEY